MKFHLFDVVRLLHDHPEDGAYAGEIATIVEVYTNPAEGYELEFVGVGGITTALFAVGPVEIEFVQSN